MDDEVRVRPVDDWMYPLPFGYGFRPSGVNDDNVTHAYGAGTCWKRVWWRIYRRVY